MRFTTQSGRRAERGYVLLTLLLFVAVLGILSLAWIEKADFQLKRDREEELIHRGVQYSRAVRRFFKKFGRYPTRIEELEDTNHVRFLRKRYKDPITGKDFKLLHMSDVQMSFSPATASTLPPGPSKANFAVFQAAVATAGMPSSPGASAGPMPDQQQTSDQNGVTAQGQPNQAVSNSGAATGPGQSSGTQLSSSATGSDKPNAGDNRVFGGGPIVGVASTSKEKSIREFNKKDHYNQWQFIYDPSIDRGGLLATPNQPPLQGAVANNPQPNQQPGNNPQGQVPGFGTSVQGPMSPEQPPQSPPQQQPPTPAQPPQQ
jgi:type II secretory pathway pseudopilin PulG